MSQILNNIIPNPFIPRTIDKGEVEGYDRRGYPFPLSVWTHIQTGKEYIVKCVANTTATKEGYPVQIVYQNTLTYEVFTCHPVRWNDRFKFHYQSYPERLEKTPSFRDGAHRVLY